MTPREKLISDLRDLKDDDYETVDLALKRAKVAASPHSLEFENASGGPGSLFITWSMITDQLVPLGFAFGDAITDDERLWRVIAYDADEDNLWVTSTDVPDKVGCANNWLSTPRQNIRRIDDVASSAKRATIRALEGAGDDADAIQLLEIAERGLAQTLRLRRAKGLCFGTTNEAFRPGAKIYFSWENMTTGLKKRGYGFGDPVDDRGRRAIATFRNGDLWVAESAPRVFAVEKM